MAETGAMLELLATLRAWPDVDLEEARNHPEWERARAWGYIMRTGELTGTGSRVLNPRLGGIVAD